MYCLNSHNTRQPIMVSLYLLCKSSGNIERILCQWEPWLFMACAMEWHPRKCFS